MAVIRTDRSKLDQALADETASLILLVGAPASLAGAVHDCAEGQGPNCGNGIKDDEWRHVFLITDPDILTEDERAKWFPTAPIEKHYAVEDRTGDNVCPGQVADLTTGGAADILKIKLAFADCEAGA